MEQLKDNRGIEIVRVYSVGLGALHADKDVHL